MKTLWVMVYCFPGVLGFQGLGGGGKVRVDGDVQVVLPTLPVKPIVR